MAMSVSGGALSLSGKKIPKNRKSATNWFSDRKMALFRQRQKKAISKENENRGWGWRREQTEGGKGAAP